MIGRIGDRAGRKIDIEGAAIDRSAEKILADPFARTLGKRQRPYRLQRLEGHGLYLAPYLHHRRAFGVRDLAGEPDTAPARANEQLVDIRTKRIEIDIGLQDRLFEVNRANEEAGDFRVKPVHFEIGADRRNIEPLPDAIIERAGQRRLMQPGFHGEPFDLYPLQEPIDRDVSFSLFQRDRGFPRRRKIDFPGTCSNGKMPGANCTIAANTQFTVCEERRIEDSIIGKRRRRLRQGSRNEIGDARLDIRLVSASRQLPVHLKCGQGIADGELCMKNPGKPSIAPVDNEVGFRCIEVETIHLVHEAKIGVADAETPQIAERRRTVAIRDERFEHGTNQGALFRLRFTALRPGQRKRDTRTRAT